MLARLFGMGPGTGRRAGAKLISCRGAIKPCHLPVVTRRTLAWLAIDLDPLIAGVIKERSEEEGARPVPVVSGGYRDGGDTL
jgi:hypothetical protein